MTLPTKGMRHLFLIVVFLRPSTLPLNKFEYPILIALCIMEQDEELRLSLMDAGQFLMRLGDMPRKETLKGAVADYIIDELIVTFLKIKPLKVLRTGKIKKGLLR